MQSVQLVRAHRHECFDTSPAVVWQNFAALAAPLVVVWRGLAALADCNKSLPTGLLRALQPLNVPRVVLALALLASGRLPALRLRNVPRVARRPPLLVVGAAPSSVLGLLTCVHLPAPTLCVAT